MNRQISDGDDVIDSRDVIARIEHLSQLEQPGPVDLGPEDNAVDQDSLFAELRALRALADEAEGSPDWTHGETLIADSHFQAYAQELAEDIGAIQANASWPNNHIDWEAAADALKQDYFSVEFGSTTYWIRS